MADQGVAGSETPSTGVVTGTILVPSEAPTPNYFWIVLTEAAVLGWIVALLW